MGDWVGDNGLILAMGSIFETASMPGVNEMLGFLLMNPCVKALKAILLPHTTNLFI